MKDFLGQPYGVGDHIIYPVMSGNSIAVVLAKVLEIQDAKVVVEPVRSSRWKQHYGRTRYIDTRTGKGIDPDLRRKDGTEPHIETDAHMRDKLTKEVIPYAQETKYLEAKYGYDKRYHRYEYLEYVPVVYKDYVQEVKVPSKAVLTVTANIVKWDTEVPPDA